MKKKISLADVEAAKVKVKQYLTERINIFQELRSTDNMNDLVNYGALSMRLDVNTEQTDFSEDVKIFHSMDDTAFNSLLTAAKTDRNAWEILRAYSIQKPEDSRLSKFIPMLAGNKPPAKKRGRQPEIMRDYFLLCSLSLLINAGLTLPSNRVTREEFNSAFVLSEILNEMNFIVRVSPATIIDIFDRREEIYYKAINAAQVIE